MRPILTPDEMRAADERTIAAGTPAAVLMYRAGREVAWAVRRRAGSCYGLRVVAVCGKGNNGGDGLVAAETLERWGARVERVRLHEGLDRATVERLLARGSVVVDAMFGTGFSGALEGDAAWLVDVVTSSQASVVAVDIPSGVDGSTGAIEGTAIRADATVVMAALKPGLVQEPGRSHAGEIEVADIGIDPGDPELGLTEASDIRRWISGRGATANKWLAGVMVVGGSAGMTGAPMMVSHAALRAGAGIVWCGIPADAGSVAGTEVIIRPLPSADGALAAEAGSAVLGVLDRFRSLVVGPGLGTHPATTSVVRSIVTAARPALVLDADGLNAFAGDVALLRERRDRPTVVTPHAGEFARLMGAPVGDDRVAAARLLATRSGAVTVLKGSGTVVAAPDGRAVVNPTGSAALATAGTGDVLSGIIGGLLARGAPAFEAAAAGAFVHGAAADVLPTEGLVAPDLLTAVPRVLEELVAGDGS